MSEQKEQKKKWKIWAWIAGILGAIGAFFVGFLSKKQPPVDPFDDDGSPVDIDPDLPEKTTVWSANGQPVKLRASASQSEKLWDLLEVGTEVEVVSRGAYWTQVNTKNRNGWYIMTEFLKFGKDAHQASRIGSGDCSLMIGGLTEDEANALLKTYPDGYKSYG